MEISTSLASFGSLLLSAREGWGGYRTGPTKNATTDFGGMKMTPTTPRVLPIIIKYKFVTTWWQMEHLGHIYIGAERLNTSEEFYDEF